MYTWLRQYEFHFWLTIKLFFLLVLGRAATLMAGLWTGHYLPAVDEFIDAVIQGYVFTFRILLS
jgi:hypothetical protein